VSTEFIEIRPPMLDWLMEEAEAKGATLQEYVIHILLEYQTEIEGSEEDEEQDNDSDDPIIERDE
jgi:hypothetical protein